MTILFSTEAHLLTDLFSSVVFITSVISWHFSWLLIRWSEDDADKQLFCKTCQVVSVIFWCVSNSFPPANPNLYCSHSAEECPPVDKDNIRVGDANRADRQCCYPSFQQQRPWKLHRGPGWSHGCHWAGKLRLHRDHCCCQWRQWW